MLGGVYCFLTFKRDHVMLRGGGGHARGLLNPLECVGIIKSPVELKRCERVFYLMELKKTSDGKVIFFNFGRNRELKFHTQKKVGSC